MHQLGSKVGASVFDGKDCRDTNTLEPPALRHSPLCDGPHLRCRLCNIALRVNMSSRDLRVRTSASGMASVLRPSHGHFLIM